MKQTAMRAAREAGKILLKNFYALSKKDVFLKGRHDFLTKVDLIAEKKILSILRKKFPNHNFLAEESGWRNKKSPYTWVIDPLDGTTNYIMKNPLFATIITLAFQKEIILGVIYLPFLKEMYTVEKGRGAFLNGRKIHVSQTKKIANSFLFFCHGHRGRDIKEAIKLYAKIKLLARNLRQFGSAGAETAFVATGRADGFIIPGASPWDVGAGVLLVREAGGQATDFQGKNWHLKSKDLAVSNGRIHQNLLKTVNRIL